MNPVATLVNAPADFGFAGLFLITWIAPYTFGVQTLRFLMLMMLTEFVVVHSSAALRATAEAPGPPNSSRFPASNASSRTWARTSRRTPRS